MTSKRGRPKGDGQNDDCALKAIAGKLVSGEAQAYNEAAAAVYLTHKPTQSHVTKTVKDRWRGKWKLRGEKYLEEARTPIMRYVEGPPADRLMMTGVDNLKQIWEGSPQQEQLRKMALAATGGVDAFNKVALEAAGVHKHTKIALAALGLTMTDLVERQRIATKHLSDPLVQQTLKQLSSPEMQATFDALKRFHS